MRHTLPNRRHTITRKVTYGDHRFILSMGIDPDTHQVMEVFYSDGMKSGTDLQHSIIDACILVSLLLQHHVSIDNIKKSLGKTEAGNPSSIVGAVVFAVEAEMGDIHGTKN